MWDVNIRKMGKYCLALLESLSGSSAQTSLSGSSAQTGITPSSVEEDPKECTRERKHHRGGGGEAISYPTTVNRINASIDETTNGGTAGLGAVCVLQFSPARFNRRTNAKRSAVAGMYVCVCVCVFLTWHRPRYLTG